MAEPEISLLPEDADLPKLIVFTLLKNEEFCRKVIRNLKPEYFEFPLDQLVKILVAYFLKYQKIPSLSALVTELKAVFKDSSDRKEKLTKCFSALKMIAELKFDPVEEFPWIYENTKHFIRKEALREAIIDSADILQDPKSKEDNFGRVEKKVRDAIGIVFDEELGLDYFATTKERYDRMKEEGYTVSTGFEQLDTYIGGGWHNRSLSVVVGSTNVGKTLLLSNFSTNLVKQGADVLYLTLEIVEDEIAKRMDGGFCNIRIEDLEARSNLVIAKLEEIKKADTIGKLIIKEFPSGFTPQQLHSYLQELELKKSFVPRVIIIDYIGEMSPAYGRSDDSYRDLKVVASDLRALAMTKDVPIITAAQINRSGYDHQSGLHEIADSMGIPMVADLVILVHKDENLDRSDMLKGVVLKNRFGRNQRHFDLHVDYETLEVIGGEKAEQKEDENLAKKLKKM